MCDWIEDIALKIIGFFKKEENVVYEEPKIDENENISAYGSKILKREEVEKIRQDKQAQIVSELVFDDLIYFTQNKLLNLPSDRASYTLTMEAIKKHLSEVDQKVLLSDRQLVLSKIVDVFSDLGYTAKYDAFYSEVNVAIK